MIIYKADEIKDIKLGKDLVKLLSLLERVNPCSQYYEEGKDCLIVSYSLKLNLFSFKNMGPLYARAEITGLPISISQKGYYGDLRQVLETIKKRKGLKILLNADEPLPGGGKTLSTFEFENRFMSFEDYLNSLRSSYRRRIKSALNMRDKLVIRKIQGADFSQKHYDLYLSIMERTSKPLEIISMDFFREYDSEIYEFLDKESKNPLAFIQVKEFNGKLCFLFGGFRREDVAKYDIYYNMLLKIIEVAIEKRVKAIEFGQTSEESKLKIGCREVCKYLYVHHSNRILNFLIQKMLPFMAYKPYTKVHHVFKEGL